MANQKIKYYMEQESLMDYTEKYYKLVRAHITPEKETRTNSDSNYISFTI